MQTDRVVQRFACNQWAQACKQLRCCNYSEASQKLSAGCSCWLKLSLQGTTCSGARLQREAALSSFCLLQAKAAAVPASNRASSSQQSMSSSISRKRGCWQVATTRGARQRSSPRSSIGPGRVLMRSRAFRRFARFRIKNQSKTPQIFFAGLPPRTPCRGGYAYRRTHAVEFFFAPQGRDFLICHT